MLDGAMIVWFTLTALSLAILAYDLTTNSPVSWVQKLGWALVVVYTGPVGFVLFLLACRRPFPGGHDAFTRPVWKQAVNSEVHCLAGDATGILIAASIVPVFGLPNGWDAVIEYAAGFACGLFIFQALMMIGMFDGNYWMAVRKTFFSETVSMNLVMAGMIPAMVLLAHAWPGSESPAQPSFWFRMSLASLAGGLLGYPVNYWLVSRHLKHGCMTLPGADPDPHLGHRPPEAAHSESSEHAHGGAGAERMSGMGHAHHGEGDDTGMDHAPHGEGDDTGMDHAHHGEGDDTGMDHAHHGEGDDTGMDHAHHGEGEMAGIQHSHHGQMTTLPLGTQITWIIATTAVVLIAVAATSIFVPIRF